MLREPAEIFQGDPMNRPNTQAGMTFRCGVHRFAKHLHLTGLILAIFLVICRGSYAQQLTGTLSGTSYDQSGAVVPNATVVVKNQASNDTRQTVSNASGYFTLTGLQPGTYNVTVSA